MEQIDRFAALGLFDARVPRYTSYPAAPVFAPQTGVEEQARWLAALPADVPVSVYVHIPFCERLCWFCACRTQGTRSLAPVEAYVEVLKAELALMAVHLPPGLRMARLHWGGGTPTILPPALITELAAAIKATFPPAPGFEFSVEIDPTLVDEAKIAALAAAGMNRASIGIQDFLPAVQAAIGREQPYDLTRACVESLRRAGIASLNADLVYGLPHQDLDTLAATIAQVLTLAPDRIALFGYAHVPHMAKRQKLIDETALPGDVLRYRLAELAAGLFREAGFQAIGIDHFARPEDGLARAARSGTLRRNFQGYTTDGAPTLIGVGASSISRFAQGYVQNVPATAAYQQRIAAGRLAGHRGHAMTAQDSLRARAIEMLMCDFRLDRAALRAEFGEAEAGLAALHQRVAAAYPDDLRLDAQALTILPQSRALTRLIARVYDAYAGIGAQYSKAS